MSDDLKTIPIKLEPNSNYVLEVDHNLNQDEMCHINESLSKKFQDQNINFLVLGRGFRIAGLSTINEDAIDLLRSAYAIAKREGRETNWRAFHDKVRDFFESRKSCVNQ